PEEGGTDKPRPIPFGAGLHIDLTLRQLYEYEMVPWGALPGQFRDPNQFPPNIGLGQRVRSRFAGFWIQPALEPRKQRDLMLRGHYHKASPLLNDDSTKLEGSLDAEKDLARKLAADGTSLSRVVSDWAETKARPLYAELEAVRERQ